MIFLTVPLVAGYKKNVFNCGERLLDDYLHTQAKQDVLKKVSACFVLAAEDKTIKGYYTLSSAAIQRDSLPEEIIKRLPPSYSYLPVTLLGRLAVDVKYQGQGLGELILIDALKRCNIASSTVASMAVIVDPINEAAKIFYVKYGFLLLPDSGKMFLPMKTISALFKEN